MCCDCGRVLKRVPCSPTGEAQISNAVAKTLLGDETEGKREKEEENWKSQCS